LHLPWAGAGKSFLPSLASAASPESFAN